VEKQQKINFAIYSSLLKDGIVRNNFTLPNGENTYFDGKEELNIVANQNVDRMLIYGAFIGYEGNLTKDILMGSKLNFTKGRIIEEEYTEPAAHIPPLFGIVWLKYKHKKLEVKFSSLFNGAKNINDYGGSVDNPEYATEDGTYAWNIFNLESNYAINDNLSISFAIENILDKHYRTFASGVSAPGFNAVVSVQGKL